MRLRGKAVEYTAGQPDERAVDVRAEPWADLVRVRARVRVRVRGRGRVRVRVRVRVRIRVMVMVRVRADLGE